MIIVWMIIIKDRIIEILICQKIKASAHVNAFIEFRIRETYRVPQVGKSRQAYRNNYKEITPRKQLNQYYIKQFHSPNFLLI
jgi:hypothetical protein